MRQLNIKQSNEKRRLSKEFETTNQKDCPFLFWIIFYFEQNVFKELENRTHILIAVSIKYKKYKEKKNLKHE